MFIGRPPGNYDRLLDFSRPVTGSLFFVPSATFLDAGAPSGAEPAETPPPAADRRTLPVKYRRADGSLGIGSLKGDTRHE